MENKKIKFLLLAAATLVVLAVSITSCKLQEELSLRITSPVNVYLTSGWHVEPNRVIGVLPAGVVVSAKPIVEKDHMVYQIEFQSSNEKKLSGYVMYNGGCDSTFSEVTTIHHLFAPDEIHAEDCPKK